MQKKTNKVAVLKKFFVYKGYRGKKFGIGTGLYEALLDFAKKQGFSKVILDTPSKATRSHSFYKKVGFMVEGELLDEFFVDGNYHNAIRMCMFQKQYFENK